MVIRKGSVKKIMGDVDISKKIFPKQEQYRSPAGQTRDISNPTPGRRTRDMPSTTVRKAPRISKS